MTLAQAKGYIPRAIKGHTGHGAYHLKRTCARTADSAFDCEISWASSRGLYSSTLIFAGTLSLEDRGATIGYAFDGLRARASCVRRKSVKRCAHHVAW
jgi:hypothetical protein